MISTLDFLITRLLGISSMAILVGHFSILGLDGSTASRTSHLVLEKRLCVLCTFDGSPSSRLDQDVVLEDYSGVSLHTDRSQRFPLLVNAEPGQFVSYTPPGCSDTDSDQTNNCGPGDSTDAGTRMSS